MKKKQTPYKPLKKDTKAVSVIIGAMLLTLIVVTAAVSFALFTAARQEEIQQKEFQDLLREQEDLNITSISQLDYDNNNKLDNISFLVTNNNIRESNLDFIRLNDRYVMEFIVYRITDDIYEQWTYTNGKLTKQYNPNEDFIIESKETILINISKVYENVSLLTVTITEPINFAMRTNLQREFKEYFLPPTANIKFIKNSETEIVLDGSLSHHSNNLAEIVTYEWNVTHMILPFFPYVFQDIDQSSSYSRGDIIINQTIDNSVSNPLYGQPAGLLALNNSNIAFIYQDVNDNGIYDGKNSNDKILNLSTNESGIPCNPNEGAIGGLLSFDNINQPFLFIDSNGNSYYDSEEMLESNPLGDGIAIPNNDFGGLYANDSSGEFYTFMDLNQNNKYDIGEPIIEYDADNNTSPADPRPTLNQKGGLWANASGQWYIFLDNNYNYLYDDESITSPLTGNPTNDEGGLFAHDNNNKKYTFKDVNNNWIFNTELLQPDLDGNSKETYIFSESVIGGLVGIDKNGKNFTFFDNGNTIYDQGEFLETFEYNTSEYHINKSTNTISISAGEEIKGGLYALDENGIAYIFDDINGNWMYDLGEILYISISGLSATPKVGQEGGLLAFNSTNESFYFKDINGNGICDTELLELIDLDAKPESNQPGGLYAFDTSNNFYTFYDANENWIYDENEPIINLDPDIDSTDATPSQDDAGGLYALNNTNIPYLFNDSNQNWQYDQEELLEDDPDNDATPAVPQNGQKGGLWAKNTSGKWYVYTDTNLNWQYNSETIISLDPHPYNDTILAKPEHEMQGGLMASYKEMKSYPLNNQYGKEKTIIIDKPDWAYTMTIVNLQIWDNFGMIGRDTYTLMQPPKTN